MIVSYLPNTLGKRSPYIGLPTRGTRAIVECDYCHTSQWETGLSHRIRLARRGVHAAVMDYCSGCGKYRFKHDDVDQMVSLYRDGKTQDEIANLFHTSQGVIYRHLKRRGVVCKVTNRKHNWNFGRLDERTPEMAYWMGFCMADGSVHYRGNGKSETLTLAIAESDLEHLYKFCDFFEFPRDAVFIQRARKPNQQNFCWVFLTKKGIMAQCRSWGIVINKTRSENFYPPSVVPRLLPHYIRGWIDGDGTIYTGKGSPSINIACNSANAHYLQDALGEIGLNGRVYYLSGVMYRVSIRGKNKIRLAHRILNGYPRLERKWGKVDLLFHDNTRCG